MPAGKALALAVLAALLSLVVIAPVLAFVVLVVAGPHAGLLPQWLEVVVLVAGWLSLLAAPIFIGRWLYRRLRARAA